MRMSGTERTVFPPEASPASQAGVPGPCPDLTRQTWSRGPPASPSPARTWPRLTWRRLHWTNCCWWGPLRSNFCPLRGLHTKAVPSLELWDLCLSIISSSLPDNSYFLQMSSGKLSVLGVVSFLLSVLMDSSSCRL